MATVETKNPHDPANYPIELLPCAKRIRAMVGGEEIVDSVNGFVLREHKHLPVYYFPRADVRMDLLERTDHSTHCPYKGDANYFTINAGGETRENAVWTYETPLDTVADMKDLVSFYWLKMDQWLEEDETVIRHARDPHVRVDTLPSSRHVKVTLAGETVADSRNGVFLFETDLPPRYYLPKEDVRQDLLLASDTTSECPYKGEAKYYSLQIGGEIYKDFVWYYPEPLHESARIKNLLCFYDEKVDQIELDGVQVPKPNTPWS
jgi:uncharacterized protein (DUF427 family)